MKGEKLIKCVQHEVIEMAKLRIKFGHNVMQRERITHSYTHADTE